MPRRAPGDRATLFRWVLVLAVMQGVTPEAAATSAASESERGAGSRPEVTIVTDEADAALAILSRLGEGRPVRPGDWDRLHASDGYRRLKRREAAMGRAFDDSVFAAFLLADSTRTRVASLAETVAEWKRGDLDHAGRLALAYLPRGARIRAKVYLLIKPRPNSFVFDQATDPAIFMFVDPQVTRAKLENTLAHELHHIGYAAACSEEDDSTRSAPVQTCLTWMSAFGEGVAMLAAAGGPAVHPHAVSPPEERGRWDRDMEHYDADFRKLEEFFLDVVEGRISDPDSIRSLGMSFFGEQGPWYTVGYRMAVLIERSEGRDALLAAICDPRSLLEAYNRAAARQGSAGIPALPLWSEALLSPLRGPGGR